MTADCHTISAFLIHPSKEDLPKVLHAPSAQKCWPKICELDVSENCDSLTVPEDNGQIASVHEIALSMFVNFVQLPV